MKRLISGEKPLAEATTQNTNPTGMIATAIGAISTQPRHTPFAVKHGRPVRSATSVCSTMALFESEARVWSIDPALHNYLIAPRFYPPARCFPAIYPNV